MRLQKKLILFLLLFILISFPKKVNADDFKCIPFVNVKEEYNDNILFDNKNSNYKERDFITTISPGLKLSNRTEKFNSGLSIRFDRFIYSDNTELNNTDKDYRGNLDYQLTHKTGISANAGYGKSSRRDRDIDVVDDETGATGLILDNSIRIRHNYGFSSQTTFSEIFTIAPSYSFTKDDYENKEDNDLRMHIINLGFTHNLNFIDEITVGRLNLRYAKYKYLESEIIRSVLPDPSIPAKIHYFNGTDVNSYSVTIGASRNLNEVFSILVDLGCRYTKSEIQIRQLIKVEDTVFSDTGNMQHQSSNSGFVGQITAAYTGKLTNGSLNFHHDLAPSSGRSSATERTSMSFELSRRFTYELKGSLSMRYYLNKAGRGEFSPRSIDEKTKSIRTAIRYDFTNNLFIEAAYYFINIKDYEDNTDTNRNQIFIKFSMNCPLFE